MLVPEIAKMFRQLADESDKVWLSKPDVTMWLKLAYEEFRRPIIKADESIYAEYVAFTFPANTQSYDLGGTVNPIRLLGPSVFPLFRKRLLKMHTIAKMQADGIHSEYYLTAAHSPRDVEGLLPHTYPSTTYFLSGTTLYFGAPVEGIYVIGYTPESTVDWSKQASTDTEWVDDMTGFHDLIAYNAAALYQARDGAINPAVAQIRAERKQELIEFVLSQRAKETFEMVVEY